MITHKKLPLLAYAVLVLVWIYTFYVSVIAPPFLGYFTVDENYIADSGVFLWYGATPRCLDWPATPSVLTFFLMFGLWVAFETIAQLGSMDHILNVFEGIDRTAFEYITSREHLLLSGRTIQLLIVGLFMFLLIRYLFKQKHDLLTDTSRLIIAWVILTSYLLWFNAPVLRPEALAGSIFIYLFARLLFSTTLTSRDISILSILFGIVLAERLLFVFIAPLVLAGIYCKAERNPIRYSARFIGLTCIVFLVFCPFLITDPLVVLKSFFGGILAKMQDKPMATFFNYEFIKEYFKNPISYLIVLLSGIGSWILVIRRNIFYYILLGNWAFFLFLVLRSAKIYDTHVLPAGIITLFTLGLGISYLAEKTAKRPLLVASLLTLPIAVSNLYEYVSFQQRSHTQSTMAQSFLWIKENLPSGTRILVHPELEFYLPKNQETLRRNLTQNGDSLKMLRKLNYLLGNQAGKTIKEKDLPLVARSFAFEDERLYEIQYQLLSKYNTAWGDKTFDYDVYLDNTELASSSVKTEDGIRDFRDGKYEYMVTDIHLDGLDPVIVFMNDLYAPTYIYRTNKDQKIPQ